MEYGLSIALTSDGGYVVLARSWQVDPPSTFALLRIDSDGDIIWSKIINDPMIGWANRILPLSDGGIALAGTVSIPFCGVKERCFFVARLNADGNVTWSRVFEGIGLSYVQTLSSTEDGGYSLAVLESALGGNSLFIKLDERGLLTWQKTYRLPITESSTGETLYFSGTSCAIAPLDDGNLLAAAHTFNQLAVLKLDAQGELLWERVWADQDEWDATPWCGVFGLQSHFAIHSVPSSGILLRRNCYRGSGQWFDQELKMDHEGAKQWERYYLPPSEPYLGRSTVTSREKLLLATGTNLLASGGDAEIALRDIDVPELQCPITYLQGDSVLNTNKGLFYGASVAEVSAPNLIVSDIVLTHYVTTAVRELTCPAGADLSATISMEPAVVSKADYLTIKGTVTNHGPELSNKISATLEIPAGIEVLSIASTDGQACSLSDTSIDCSIAELPDRDAVTVTVIGTVLQDPLEATFQVTGETIDPVLTNNTATASSRLETHVSGDFVNERFAYASSGRIVTSIDENGRPHVIYSEYNDDRSCKFVHAVRVNGAWEKEQIFNTGSLFCDLRSLDFDVDTKGHLHVAFATNLDGLVWYGNDVSGTWQFESVDFNSTDTIAMAVDGFGAVHFACYGKPEDGPFYFGLMYRRRTEDGWSEAIALEEVGGVLEGISTHIDTDSLGRPHITYVGGALEDYRYTFFDGTDWHFHTLADGVGSSAGNDISVDEEDYVHITYHHLQTSALHYVNNKKGFWIDEVVDDYGWSNSLAVDTQGKAHLVYGNAGLRYATNVAGYWDYKLVDNVTTGGDIAVDGTGMVHVVYAMPYEWGIGYPAWYAHNISEDMDHDGISDAQEQGVDGMDSNYDGNDDGIADRTQANVASLLTYDGSRYVTIEAEPSAFLMDVQAIDNPSPEDMPDGVDYSFGFFAFRVGGINPGSATVVTLYLPDEVETYYKYGPIPDNPHPHWYEFLLRGDGTGAVIEGNKVQLYLVDGGRGDSDLIISGEIVEPGAPEMSGHGLILDADGDGLPDDWEIDHQLDPLHYGRFDDPDSDGLLNYRELELGAHPMLSDTDGDQMEDGFEDLYGLNPVLGDAQEDPDGDMFPNGVEHHVGTDPRGPQSYPMPPEANAGPGQTVDANELVHLSGSGSWDPDFDITTYQWQQVAGPTVDLVGQNARHATFTSPVVGADTQLEFILQVTDAAGLVAQDGCEINVLPGLPDDPDGDGIIDDSCPNTPAGDVVNSEGCSVHDLCPCGATWKNHGEYVRCVSETVKQFAEGGLIARSDTGLFVKDAGRSDCGK